MKIKTGLTREEFRQELSELVCSEWTEYVAESTNTLESMWEEAKNEKEIKYCLYTIDSRPPSWLQESNQYCKHMAEEILGKELACKVFQIIKSTEAITSSELRNVATLYMTETSCNSDIEDIENYILPLIRLYGNFMDIQLLQEVRDLEFPFEFIGEQE